MLRTYESGDGQESHLRSSVTAPGRGWLYLAKAHSFVITLQHSTLSMSLQTLCHFGAETTSKAEWFFLSASRRLNLNINSATQGLCFASDLVFSDGVSSVMKFALCKIERQSEDFSKRRHAGRGVDVG